MDRGKGSAMKRTSGFTIIEVLVVVGIVAVLMGLLFPAVGMVQKSGRASASQSNLRQWATGTMGFLNINREQLPWEGLKDANDMPTNLAERRFWANAIPPMVGQRPYREIVDQCFAESVNVPMPEDGTIFCDPAAVPEGDAPYAYGQPGANGWRRQFFFNYVPNSQLNNTYLAENGFAEYTPDKAMRLAQIPRADATILMVEMRASKRELRSDDPFYDKDLKRHRCDWKRFAGRHFDGGHLAFVDGHVAHARNADVITNIQGTQDPSQPEGDWNHPEMIWDPQGPALDEN